jgi:hypothetical protein
MRYNKDFIQLNYILKNMLVKYDLNNLTPENKLFQNWPEMVGRELGECFIPRYLRDGVLYLEISNALADRELKSTKKRLMHLLSSLPGEKSIKNVKFI